MHIGLLASGLGFVLVHLAGAALGYSASSFALLSISVALGCLVYLLPFITIPVLNHFAGNGWIVSADGVGWSQVNNLELRKGEDVVLLPSIQFALHGTQLHVVVGTISLDLNLKLSEPVPPQQRKSTFSALSKRIKQVLNHLQLTTDSIAVIVKKYDGTNASISLPQGLEWTETSHGRQFLVPAVEWTVKQPSVTVASGSFSLAVDLDLRTASSQLALTINNPRAFVNFDAILTEESSASVNTTPSRSSLVDLDEQLRSLACKLEASAPQRMAIYVQEGLVTTARCGLLASLRWDGFDVGIERLSHQHWQPSLSLCGLHLDIKSSSDNATLLTTDYALSITGDLGVSDLPKLECALTVQRADVNVYLQPTRTWLQAQETQSAVEAQTLRATQPQTAASDHRMVQLAQLAVLVDARVVLEQPSLILEVDEVTSLVLQGTDLEASLSRQGTAVEGSAETTARITSFSASVLSRTSAAAPVMDIQAFQFSLKQHTYDPVAQRANRIIKVASERLHIMLGNELATVVAALPSRSPLPNATRESANVVNDVASVGASAGDDDESDQELRLILDANVSDLIVGCRSQRQQATRFSCRRFALIGHRSNTSAALDRLLVSGVELHVEDDGQVFKLLQLATVESSEQNDGIHLKSAPLQLEWRLHWHQIMLASLQPVLSLRSNLSRPAQAPRRSSSSRRHSQSVFPTLVTEPIVIAIAIQASAKTTFQMELDMVMHLHAYTWNVACRKVTMAFDSATVFQLDELKVSKELSPTAIEPTMALFSQAPDLYKLTSSNVTSQPEHDYSKDGVQRLFGPVQAPASLWLVQAAHFELVARYGLAIGVNLDHLKNAVRKAMLLTRTVLGPLGQSTTDVPKVLPSVVFRVKRVSFRFEHDPFEIKLARTLTVLRDEAEQQYARYTLIQERLEELKTTGNPTSPQQEMAIWDAFHQKNSDLYLQATRETTFQDRPLMETTYEDVQLTMLHEPDMADKQLVARYLNDMDPGACSLEQIPNHSMAHIRKFHLRMASMAVRITDVCLPLLEFRNMEMHGTAAVVEPEPGPLAEYTVPVWLQGAEELPYTKRTAPLKMYHAVFIKAEELAVAWGQCLDPIISHVSLIVDLLDTKGVDPSPVTPYFDKARQLRHGFMDMELETLKIIALASLVPSNPNERLEMTANNCKSWWRHARLGASGDAQWVIHTPSKFDNCPIVDYPGLEVEVLLHWLCEGDPSNHHAVLPASKAMAAPDHDAFRAFRSDRLEVEMHTNVTGQNQRGVSAAIILYSNTLSWCFRLQEVMAVPSSSVRKGNLYGTGGVLKPSRSWALNTLSEGLHRRARYIAPPRKPSLGEHTKQVRLHFTTRRLGVLYYNQYMRKEGLFVVGNEADFKLLYTHEPIPIVQQKYDLGTLRHRTTYEWILAATQGNIDHLQMSTLFRDEYTYGKDATLESEMLVRDVWQAFADADRMSNRLASAFDIFGDGNVQTSAELGCNEDGSIPLGREAWHHLMACTRWTFESKELASSLDSEQDNPFKTLSFTGGGSRSPSVSVSVFDDDDTHHSPQGNGRSVSFSGPNSFLSPIAAAVDVSRLGVSSRLVSAHDDSIIVDPSTHIDDQDHIFGQWLSVENMRMHWSWDVRKVTAPIYRNYQERRLLNFELSPAALKPLLIEDDEDGRTSRRGRLTSSSGPTLEAALEHILQQEQRDGASSPRLQHKRSSDPLPDESTSPIDEIDLERDVTEHKTLVHLSKPQVCMKGPNFSQHVTIVAESAALELRNHSLAYRQGRFDMKESYKGTYHSLEYFYAEKPKTSVTWINSDQLAVAGYVIDGSMTPHPLYRIVYPCFLQTLYISYFHDAAAAKRLSRRQQRRLRNLQMKDSKSLFESEEKVYDTARCHYPTLNMETTGPQWAVSQDIMFELLIGTDRALQESLDRRETLHYLAQLRQELMQERQGHVEMRQRSVRQLLGRLKAIEYQIWQLDAPASDKPTQLAQLHQEWAELKRVSSLARRDLRLRVSSLRESCFAPGELSYDQDLVHMMSITNSVGLWNWTVRDQDSIIVEKSIRNMYYYSDGHDNGAGERRLEIGDMTVFNKIPGEKYPLVLGRYQSHKQGASPQDILLRYYYREAAPVGGIAVIEHTEVNFAPLLVQISAKLAERLEPFYTPATPPMEALDTATDGLKMPEERTESPRKASRKKRPRASSSAIANDIEEMRLRALKHQTFIYVKIPPIQLCVSYKSEGSMADIHNFVLKLPTYEYHNQTCTTADMFNTYKKEVSGHVLTQAISHKLFGRDDSSAATIERKEAASLDERKLKLLGKHGVAKDDSSKRKNLKSKIARRFGFGRSKSTSNAAAPKSLDSGDEGAQAPETTRSTSALAAAMNAASGSPSPRSSPLIRRKKSWTRRK
eukprot:m.267005 g.267005  ORF g.267005 m.267005 type:complete len:2379 (-) comp17632_c0_seq2:341-7477(-)